MIGLNAGRIALVLFASETRCSGLSIAVSVRRISAAVFLSITAVFLYGTLVRSWMRNWGASVDEVRAKLPGESDFVSLQYQSRRAITINAPAEVVWSWLIQIGQGRGGFYSYDWLENLFDLHIHSTNRDRA
jgi:hypothetical protein